MSWDSGTTRPPLRRSPPRGSSCGRFSTRRCAPAGPSAAPATPACARQRAFATITVPGPGPIEARLDAASGDWDLAILDDTGRAVAASSGADASEFASGWAWKAGELRVQACRRSGDTDEARVTVEHGVMPAALIEELAQKKIKVVDVATPTRAEKDRLTDLGFDLTEHGGINSLGVVLHGEADEERLRNAGFTFKVLEDDLVGRGLREGARNARYAARVQRSALPSGRDSYRTLADYEDELKTLADENPGLVRLITLPEQTWLGRDVLGVEIATNVNLNDGRPAFANLGVHHAREWPSGEHAMEWAYELINGFKAGDARATRIVQQSRNIVVPIVNPDGFNASRTAGTGVADGGRDESVPDTVYLAGGAATGGEYRRKNCRVEDQELGNCGTSAGLAELGTDPNRNYGGLWGGPGSSTDPTTQTYRGPGPFSEPETRNIQALVSTNQVMTLITNHTTAGLVLRAPGLQVLGDPIDEDRGYKALGDAMALENGYFSQKGFELYDTTGTTEDWSYNTTGGFGFTFEIYCGAPNYETGNCDDPAFHPFFETMVMEWDGTSPQSDHADDPGRSDAAPFGMQAGYDGKGNREAYYIAAESTINEARHSVIEGQAVPGAKLRLTKEFQTATYPQGDGEEAEPILFDDRLETVYDVPESGAFRWHINPSSRPIVAKDRGRAPTGAPSPEQTFMPRPGPPTVPCTPLLVCAVGNDDQEFTVPSGPGIDNEIVRLRIQWDTQASDYDLKIYRPGASPIDQSPIVQSQQRGTDYEEVAILKPTGTYLIRVANVNGVEPWEGTITYEGPQPFEAGKQETWTLTCEVGGQVLSTTQVLIVRGEVKQPDLGACDRRPPAQTVDVPVPPVVVPPVVPGPAADCIPARGFRSVSARAARQAGPARLRPRGPAAGDGRRVQADARTARAGRGPRRALHEPRAELHLERARQPPGPQGDERLLPRPLQDAARQRVGRRAANRAAPQARRVHAQAVVLSPRHLRGPAVVQDLPAGLRRDDEPPAAGVLPSRPGRHGRDRHPARLAAAHPLANGSAAGRADVPAAPAGEGAAARRLPGDDHRAHRRPDVEEHAHGAQAVGATRGGWPRRRRSDRPGP